MILADITEGDVLARLFVLHSREIFETDLGKFILSTLYSIASVSYTHLTLPTSDLV